MLVFRLALRAIRWRAGAAATIFAVALVAVLAATVGPIYLHAVDERVFDTHVRHAGQFERDVLVSRTSDVGYDHVDWDGQVRRIADGFARRHFYASPLSSTQLVIGYDGKAPLRGDLATVAGQCAHLHLVAGRCVPGASRTDTVISTRTASAEHLHVGDTVAAAAASTGASIRLRVIGVYRPLAPHGYYWQPWDFFQSGQPVSGDVSPLTDAAFVSPRELAHLLLNIPETFEANVRFLPARTGYDDMGALRAAFTQASTAVARFAARAGSTGVPVASITADLPAVLSETSKETSLAGTLVTVATAQLALLAILVLYAVVANTTTAQGPEVALARLRGRHTRSVVLQGVAQPLFLVLLAAPVAALLAWVLVRLLAARLLGQTVDVTFPLQAYGVAALAAAGGVLAAAVAARRVVVTPVGALLRRGGDASSSPIGLLVADASALTIAVAGLVELREGGVLEGGSPNPLAVLAPSLLAVGAAVVLLRLLPFAGRRLAAWTRDSRRVATFLAVRQLLRRPAETRALLLVAVALAIAAFAVTNWSDAEHNRELRALNAAGADTVLVVQPRSADVDLRGAVDRADPSGQSMAAVYSEADALPALLAVDTTRFRNVAAWVRGNTGPDLAAVLRRLTAGQRAPVTLSGSRLRLTIDLTAHPKKPVHLAVSLSEPDREVAVRTVTPVAAGSATYTVSLPAACARACRFAGLSFYANTPNDGAVPTLSRTIDARLAATVYEKGAWRPIDGFTHRDRWRGDGKGQVSIGTDGSALQVSIRQGSGAAAWPSVLSASQPTALTGVVASTTAAQYVGNQIHSIATLGLDGQTVTADGRIRAVTLPQVDRRGILVDYATALDAMNDGPAQTTQFQVWLSPSAPRDMIARLARRHVRVTRVIRASTYRSALDRTGSAYADTLFLLAALAATVLAVGATAAGRVVSTRRRAYELAALEAVGVPARTLRRATAVEQGTIFVLGLVVGLGAGLLGSRLALPSTPVFVDTATGPPLVFGLPWTLLALLAAGLSVVFVLASVLIAALVERAATPGQLRGAQQ